MDARLSDTRLPYERAKEGKGVTKNPDTYPDLITMCLNLKLQSANADNEGYCCELGLVATKKNQANQTVLPSPQIDLVTSLIANLLLIFDSEKPHCSKHVAGFKKFNCILDLLSNWKTRNLAVRNASGSIIRSRSFMIVVDAYIRVQGLP